MPSTWLGSARNRITALALAVLLPATVPVAMADIPGDSANRNQAILSAVNYLVQNYNSTVGLIHGSPDSANLSNTYWLFSDNYLASLALKRWAGNSNMSLGLLVSNMDHTMNAYLDSHPSINQYQALTTSLFPFNASKAFEFGRVGTAVVKSTVNNETGTLDPMHYTDIAFLKAIAYQNSMKTDMAKKVFDKGYGFWDGNGFNDSATQGTYATYKVALYVLAASELGQKVDSSILNLLLTLQFKTGTDEGGFGTSYTGNGHFASGSNTETTSLVILALLSPIPANAFTLTIVILGFMALIITLVVVYYYRRRSSTSTSTHTATKGADDCYEYQYHKGESKSNYSTAQVS